MAMSFRVVACTNGLRWVRSCAERDRVGSWLWIEVRGRDLSCRRFRLDDEVA